MLRSFSVALLWCFLGCIFVHGIVVKDGVAAEPISDDQTATGTESAAGHDTGHGDEANASHGNTHPLSFDPDLAIVTAIIFGLLLLILGKFAWGPIRQALDDRENYVATQLDEAKQRHEDAQRLLKEHEQKLAGATDEVRALLDQARKEADLHVADRIRVELGLPEHFARAVERFRAYVAEQTLAVELATGESGDSDTASRHEAQIGGETLRISIARANEPEAP